MAFVRFQYSAAMLAALVGLCLVTSRAAADEVDDLLAGRPVALESAALDSTVLDSTTSDPLTIDRVADETPLNKFTSSREVTSLAPGRPTPANNDVSATDDQGLGTQGPETSPAWNLSIGNPADHGLGRTTEQVQVPGFDMSQVSIVPEPSAIALGVLALIYFMIFFRRHHWVA